MTSTPAFKFPDPSVTTECTHPVTGAKYKYVDSVNSWVNDGSEGGYDDAPIKGEIRDLELWLKSHIEQFIQIKNGYQGIYDVIKKEKNDKPGITAEDFQLQAGSTNLAKEWRDFTSWEEVNYLDISKEPHSEDKFFPRSINWDDLDIDNKDKGYAFHLAPVIPEGSKKVANLANYAQFNIVKKQTATEAKGATRFEVKQTHSQGDLDPTLQYQVTLIKAIQENPAVIVANGPIEPNNHAEGTLWFDLRALTLMVNVVNPASGKDLVHQWIVCNVSPDINQDFLWNKQPPFWAPNSGARQECNVETRFVEPLAVNTVKYEHSSMPGQAVKTTVSTQKSIYTVWNSLDGLKTAWAVGPAAKLTSTPNGHTIKDQLIYASIGNTDYLGSDEGLSSSLQLRKLVKPVIHTDAARLDDTYKVFKFLGTIDYKSGFIMEMPPGCFLMTKNGKNLQNVCFSRVDWRMRPVAPPFTTDNADKKHEWNSWCQVLSLNPPELTDEEFTMKFSGGILKCWFNSVKYSTEGILQGVVDGGMKTTLAGNMNLELWQDYFSGFNSMKTGQLYIIKVGNLL